jgi:hypothetical protein
MRTDGLPTVVDLTGPCSFVIALPHALLPEARAQATRGSSRRPKDSRRALGLAICRSSTMLPLRREVRLLDGCDSRLRLSNLLRPPPSRHVLRPPGRHLPHSGSFHRVETLAKIT